MRHATPRATPTPRRAPTRHTDGRPAALVRARRWHEQSRAAHLFECYENEQNERGGQPAAHEPQPPLRILIFVSAFGPAAEIATVPATRPAGVLSGTGRARTRSPTASLLRSTFDRPVSTSATLPGEMNVPWTFGATICPTSRRISELGADSSVATADDLSELASSAGSARERSGAAFLRSSGSGADRSPISVSCAGAASVREASEPGRTAGGAA